MLALVLAAVLPLLPDQPIPPTPTGSPAATVLVPRALARVFTLPALPPPGQGKEPAGSEKPRWGVQKKVVCGTTLFIVDGSADPKMILAPPGKDPDPRMPRVAKPLCGPR